MNGYWGTLLGLLRILFAAGVLMDGLPVGGVVHSEDAGVPPAFVSWRDGRRFEVQLHIMRTA